MRYTKEKAIASGTALTLVSVIAIYVPSVNLLVALIGICITVIASVSFKD